jgi:MoaA/NifB/PqqE/SkfB family radical SAM enzyme
MGKIFSIVPANPDPFVVTWDLGRRCNYDCSYCPSHRHDNFSDHADLETLKRTSDFVLEYLSIVAEHRLNRDFHLSFTGGEPTVNPNFIKFAKYLKDVYVKKYHDRFNLFLGLTTNGAMGAKTAKGVIENFDYVTVSYHTEADHKLKNKVVERILDFKNSRIEIKVNVMFHAEMFEECKNLCEFLRSNDVKFIPRIIGEGPDSKPNFAHKYDQEQKNWFKKYWNIDVSPLGRPCCGGRTFGVCGDQGTENVSFVNERNFKDWSCSVNWYFLHIEQQTGLVYHHQTCQATLDGKRGSIGSLDESQKIVDDLRLKLETKSMPIVVCPNKLCGCGLCTPKSKNRQDLLKNLPVVIRDISIFS